MSIIIKSEREIEIMREAGKIIATVLEIPAGTVKSRLYYARKTLAAILEE